MYLGPFSALRRPHGSLFTLKTAQDARQFCVQPFWPPFRSQMHPFRILKVQWGAHVLRRRGWLKKYALAFDLRAKNNTGRSRNFRLALLVPFPLPHAPFRSQMHTFGILKVQWGGTRPPALPLDFRAKNSTGRSSVFFVGGVLSAVMPTHRAFASRSLPRHKGHFGAQARKGQRGAPPQKLSQLSLLSLSVMFAS